ncbi:ATP-utilizing chromatin assembly and remodelling N-terminal [Popillia japonica]|uniref:ATP-utilizing chromatin assembly and remodelling N-terminal n=1 Tax=Popillia japonica TaxID=7064 RepID=A0AAW1MPK0_POPJA
MPLLKKKVLEKKPLPEGLRDDEEVFHCEMTNEIFRDYDEFAERTILCNSMVWTCAMTGRSNLTYVEALQSEENARKSLKDFPLELRIPVLYLANKTKRSSFADMADDVFNFTKERYFVGENVEASFSGKRWREYHILQVMCPAAEELKNLPRINGNSADKAFFPPPLVYKYDLEQLDNEDDDVIEKMIADFTQIRRRKGTYTREKSKLFLKQYVEQNSDGMWCIKDSVLDSFGINNVKFDQIFDGPLPQFEISKKTKSAVNGKKVRQETLAKYLTKNNILDGKDQRNNLLDEMKKRQLEFKKAKEELKVKTAEEKLAEKQKKKEENMKATHMYREWFKTKDDLELEDQKKLPELTPVKVTIPERYLGDVFMIIEFVNSFSKILLTKDFFPGGFTIDIMERALTEKEVAGPLIDIIQMLLNAIFALQEEEATQTKIHVDSVHEVKRVPDEPNIDDFVKFATWALRWPRRYHGVELSKLPMYSLTVSEILRLHLLSSGARINEIGSRWRFQQRGGYTHEDDPGLHLRLTNPELLYSLSIYNVVELTTDDKLKIITCLVSQLLTYADVRDVIEERLDTIKQSKLDLRTAQFAERKRCAEVVLAKTKVKVEMDTESRLATLELEKIQKDSSKHHAEYEKKIERLIKGTNEHQILLGYDRGYRRIVKLDSIPGIFIDPCEVNCGTCLSEIVHHEDKLVGADKKVVIEHLKKTSDDMNTSDKENYPKKTSVAVNGVKNSLEEEVNLCKEHFMCSADPDNCLVHSDKRNNSSWKFIRNEEELNALIDSLNKRGMRESELLHFLQSNHSNLVKVISHTPDYLLNSEVDDLKNNRQLKKWKTRYDDANFGYPISTDPVEILRATLIENILEMEEKISAGNLGTLKVKDRAEWRKCLSECSFENFDRTLTSSVENGKLKEDGDDDRDSRESTPDPKVMYYRDPGFTLRLSHEENIEDALLQKQKEIIECLSIALAQVSHSVENKYLKKPLGHCDVKKEDIRTRKDVLKCWEQSLLACTSYSQVFLHYDTIPQGQWFCYKCLKEKEKELQLLNPEPEKKKKRRIFRDEDVEDEEDQS